MATQLLLTIGMNPLPVLVAAYRCCCQLEQESGLPAITAIFSSGSEGEARKVKDRLERKLRDEGHLAQGDALQWGEVRVSPEDPDSILTGVCSRVQDSTERLHLHYTGGTKAMAAHAMQALVERARGRFSTSYLDINDHRLRCWNLPGFAGLRDERRAWLKLTAKDLAELHGMTVVSPGSVPDAQRLVAAEALYGCVTHCDECWRQWQRWKKETWRPSFRDQQGKDFQNWPKTPALEYWPRDPIPWPAINAPGWDRLPAMLNAAYSPNPAEPVFYQNAQGSWLISVQRFGSRRKLEPFVGFLEYKALEYYVFGEMNKLVAGKTFHSFEALSLSASHRCEIDVVLSLGYQLVAISCTEATERGIIKSKGFEVWHRARQVGGDGARALVICPAADSSLSDASAAELETDLADDVGLRDSTGRPVLPVRFFGFEQLQGGCLSQTLSAYLRQDLGWQLNEGAEA